MGRKKSSIGCLFWTALVLLVLVIFLFNRGTIESVLDKTGLMTHLRREKPSDDALVVKRNDEAVDSIHEEDQAPVDAEVVPEEQVSQDVSPPTPSEVAVADEPEPEETESPPPQPSKKIRRSQLYFVFVDDEGRISLKPVARPVYYVDSPLTDTLASLLSGLSAEEVGDGLLTLVPEGTEIQGVRVQGGTAFIDFNESFRFNSFGGEGYRSQLQQIVFTATEFQTVQTVQVLVNGEKISYLGPESPFVGEPLSRDSL